MILCVDFTTLKKGGGIQVANSFIVDIFKNREKYDFTAVYFFISSENVDLKIDLHEDFHVVRLKNRNFIINTILYSYLFFKFKIDKVFTLFGPANFITYKKHITGFARPHILYPDSPFFQTLSFPIYMKLKFYYFLISFIYFIQSDVVIVETNDAFNKLKSHYFFKRKEIFVVPNMLNPVFLNFSRVKYNPYPGELRILYVSSYYSHKNFEFFENLALELNKSIFQSKYKIILTIEESEFHINSKIRDSFIFLGSVSINKIPFLYQQANVIIHPSLLEVFSACYIESIYMLKMIITADLSFAKSILNGYGFFMKNISAIECVDIIRNNLNQFYLDLHSYDNLIKPYLDSNSRTSAYIDIISKA
jgi:glycosyltransferase involved in cell wall biosynthesis